VLHSVAVCCSVWQCVVVYVAVCVAACCRVSVFHRFVGIAVSCSVLHSVAARCSVSQCVAVCSSV